RPDELQRQRRQRPVLGARRGQPPGLLDRAARGDGRRRAQRTGRAGRVDGDVGRQQLDDRRPQLRRARRLQPRGEDPAHRPAVRPPSPPPTGSAATNTIDPQHMALNITPYDEDNTAAAGTTTLRHIDQSTRLAWSNDTGSVQSDPFRWGHAYIPGYTPPAGRPTTPSTPNVSHPNLDGVLSPQTIYQSATDGMPISGRAAARNDDSIQIRKVTLTKLPPGSRNTDLKARVLVSSTGAGTAHIFLWNGDHANIP